MVLSFNQPAFIPWGGFFARLMACHRMVLLDDTFFARGFTFVNRNRIKGPDGEVWVTVPVKKKGLGRQRIKEIEIYQEEYWRGKFLATLHHAYARSIYLARVEKHLGEILESGGGAFSKMAIDILEFLRQELGIESSFVRQSDVGVEEKGVALLLKIARRMEARQVILPYPAQNRVDWRQLERGGIEVKFLKFVSPVYPQFWKDFVGNLSVLDLLLCLGREGKRLLERSFTIIRF